MPASVSQPPIPVPTQDNLVLVVNAIRNALIAASNTDAGRASASGSLTPTPSQFSVLSQIIVPVTYPTADGTTNVTINQLIALTLINRTTGQTWVWNAPANLTRNGTIGQPLS